MTREKELKKGQSRVDDLGGLARAKEAFKKVAKTDAGQEVFKYLMQYCGYHSTSTVRQVTIAADGKSRILGDILPLASIHNEAKRAVWADLRKLIPVRHLNMIEAEKEAPNAIEEETN